MFLSLLNEEGLPYLKSLFQKEELLNLKQNDTSLHEFLRDNEIKGRHMIRMASFHAIYSQLFGIKEWLRQLKKIKTTTKKWYYNKFTLNDYAKSTYSDEIHKQIMNQFPHFPLEEKASFIIEFLDFIKVTTQLDGAVAHPVTGSSQIGYTYSYRKPKKDKRGLFIMSTPIPRPKHRKQRQRIYLDGLSSVLDTQRIKKRTKLFHIKSKQHDWSNRQIGIGGSGYTRGMDLINLLKPHLLKSQAILEKLMTWASR